MENQMRWSVNVSKLREKYFPMTLSNGVEIRFSSLEVVRNCYKSMHKTVFPENSAIGPFIINPDREDTVQALRHEYLTNNYSENFVFMKNGKEIGWFMGEQSDSATFYMRNTGILPEFQNQGIYKSFLKSFLAFLKEVGFERVTSQHHPHNSRVLATKLRAGFVVQGFEADERWGTLVKLVYHCHQDRSDYFKSRFQ